MNESTLLQAAVSELQTMHAQRVADLEWTLALARAQIKELSKAAEAPAEADAPPSKSDA